MYVLVVGSAIGAAAVGYFTLNGPLINWRLDHKRTANLVREKLAQGPTLKLRHAEQELELADLLARVEQVNRRVPEESREGEFLSTISQLAETHQITIEDFRRGKSTETPTHSVVTVTITARGPHAGLCRLLDAIAKLPRLAELTQLQLKSQTGPEGYPVQLTYALYYGMSDASVENATL